MIAEAKINLIRNKTSERLVSSLFICRALSETFIQAFSIETERFNNS